MTEANPPPKGSTSNAGSDEHPSIPPDPELGNLLRRALPESKPEASVLEAVQRKLRERSGGKFYAEGWSVSKYPPIFTYLITGLFMFSVVVVLYAVLFSFSGTPTITTIEPAPIQVLPT